jgi:hypothetical protein
MRKINVGLLPPGGAVSEDVEIRRTQEIAGRETDNQAPPARLVRVL